MTLDEAIKKLGSMSTMISIRAGTDPARYPNDKPAKRWQVVALTVHGECYPPGAQDDDLLVAVNSVIAQIEDRKTAAKQFAEEYPALKELPEVKLDYLYPVDTIPIINTGTDMASQIFGTVPK